MVIPVQLWVKQGERQRLRSAHRIAEENIASDQQALITFPLHIVHYASLTVSGRENAPNGQKRRKSTLYGGIAKSEHFASLQQHVGIGDGRYSHAQAEVADLLIYALPRITFTLTAVPEMEIRLSQIRLPLPRQSRAVLVHCEDMIHMAVRQEYSIHALNAVVFQVLDDSLRRSGSV